MTTDYLGVRGTQRDSDIALVAAVARNDPTAVNTLFNEYVNAVSRYVVHLVPDLTESDLEDVVQETFIGALRSAPEYRGDCSLSTFIMRIAHHKAIDSLRRRQVVEKHEATFASMSTEDFDISDGTTSIEDGIISNQQIAMVRRSLSELPEDQRQAITLRYVLGMKVDDVAEAMGLTRRMVELLITRGRSALKGKLSGLLES
jgi:RNA polymerase sigma-70 factor (ECF subfamily)